MNPRSLRMIASCGVFSLAAILLTPAEGRAAFDVAAGYDLFATQTGTQFTGLGPLMGVPLGSFNFGGSVGVQNVGSTDTIIQRTQAATGTTSTPGMSPLVMQALQLETTAPTNFGGLGVDNYFVTLQSTHGGPASTGTISIAFGAGGLSGTFSSSIDVFFDIHKGSLNGAIVFSSDLVLSSSGTPWNTLPPPGAVTINGVNQFLSGTVGDRSQDFWPGDGTANGNGSTFSETEPNGSQHFVSAAMVPEPASVLMLGMGAIGIGVLGWRRRGRAVA
jgi:PEP-CTERM motif